MLDIVEVTLHLLYSRGRIPGHEELNQSTMVVCLAACRNVTIGRDDQRRATNEVADVHPQDAVVSKVTQKDVELSRKPQCSALVVPMIRVILGIDMRFECREILVSSDLDQPADDVRFDRLARGNDIPCLLEIGNNNETPFVGLQIDKTVLLQALNCNTDDRSAYAIVTAEYFFRKFRAGI